MFFQIAAIKSGFEISSLETVIETLSKATEEIVASDDLTASDAGESVNIIENIVNITSERTTNVTAKETEV